MMDPADLLAATANGKFLEGFRFPLLAGLVALLVSWLLTPWVRKLAFAKGAVDDPKRDDRRIHKEPLPRWGGIAIYIGFVVSSLIVLPFAYPFNPIPLYLVGILAIGGLLVVIGALDDLYQYPAKIQLIALLAAGVGVQFLFDNVGRVQMGTIGIPFSGGYYLDIKAWYLAVPLTAIYIFVVTKTMDTIDGVDGLAAGIAAISATTLAIIAATVGQPRVAMLAAAIGGASLGFLRHNYNPAKIIMGTGGAYILGFTLACLSIVGALKVMAAIALIVPLLAFGVPIFDAFFVITKRVMSGVPITQADKRHVHHTLLGKGLSQRQTVLVLYAVTAALCGVLLMLVIKRG
ncbi:MAG: undecaprenyl/decaprenyl-phosphate alpha-N-acetylglucosaminyl 1-phosphate transferase [Fimbriimonadaceae bacterium]|nr:undecaprenyl/decaprenyl-phosphate alpha-N-acetylglucosaminyl 1-phosphate transferase [Fimbriimonadaceae bacterium]